MMSLPQNQFKILNKITKPVGNKFTLPELTMADPEEHFPTLLTESDFMPLENAFPTPYLDSKINISGVTCEVYSDKKFGPYLLELTKELSVYEKNLLSPLFENIIYGKKLVFIKSKEKTSTAFNQVFLRVYVHILLHVCQYHKFEIFLQLKEFSMPFDVRGDLMGEFNKLIVQNSTNCGHLIGLSERFQFVLRNSIFPLLNPARTIEILSIIEEETPDFNYILKKTFEKNDCSCPECVLYDLGFSFLFKQNIIFFVKSLGVIYMVGFPALGNAVELTSFHRKLSIGEVKTWNIGVTDIELSHSYLVESYDYTHWDEKNLRETRFMSNGKIVTQPERFVFVSHIWELPYDPDPLNQVFLKSNLKYNCFWLDFISIPQKIYGMDSMEHQHIRRSILFRMYDIQKSAEFSVKILPKWGHEEYSHRGWCIAEQSLIGESPMLDLLSTYSKTFGFYRALQMLRIHLSDLSDANAICRYFGIKGGQRKPQLVSLWDFICVAIEEREKKKIENDNKKGNNKNQKVNHTLENKLCPTATDFDKHTTTVSKTISLEIDKIKKFENKFPSWTNSNIIAKSHNYVDLIFCGYRFKGKVYSCVKRMINKRYKINITLQDWIKIEHQIPKSTSVYTLFRLIWSKSLNLVNL